MALDYINGKPTALVLHEDNQACIEIIAKGYSYELRHVARTQGVDMSFLNEIFHTGELSKQCKVVYEPTDHQVADVMTKALTVKEFQRKIFRLGIRKQKTVGS